MLQGEGHPLGVALSVAPGHSIASGPTTSLGGQLLNPMMTLGEGAFLTASSHAETTATEVSLPS